jgi:hypothetical protein
MFLHISVIDAPKGEKLENDAKKTPEFATPAEALEYAVYWVSSHVDRADLYRAQLMTLELVLGGTDLPATDHEVTIRKTTGRD